MICAYNNIMTNYDVTMDISSNIITYCDVIMGHRTKKVVSTTWFPQKVMLWTESPMEIWLWRFRSKQAIVWHKIILPSIHLSIHPFIYPIILPSIHLWPPFSLILSLFGISFSLGSEWVQMFFVRWTRLPKIWWSTSPGWVLTPGSRYRVVPVECRLS